MVARHNGQEPVGLAGALHPGWAMVDSSDMPEHPHIEGSQTARTYEGDLRGAVG